MSTRDQFADWMADKYPSPFQQEEGDAPADPPGHSSDADKLAAVTAELDALKQANSLRDLRTKVSRDTGVPASLLTGETEDACRAQAAAIVAYAESVAPEAPPYPIICDGGEIPVPQSKMAQFEEWVDATIGRLPPRLF